MISKPFWESFWKFIDTSGDCWEWTRSVTNAGYGEFYYGVKEQAHRFMWEVFYGPIPPGKIICHRCDNTRCVKISHLFMGTDGDNVRDKIRKGRRAIAGGRRKGGWCGTT